MYRYVLKDGRVFYTDINYFPEIYTDEYETLSINNNYINNLPTLSELSKPTSQNNYSNHYDYQLTTELRNRYDKNTTIVSTQYGECYHFLKCHELKKFCRLTTIAEAKSEGLRPCNVCKPPLN